MGKKEKLIEIKPKVKVIKALTCPCCHRVLCRKSRLKYYRHVQCCTHCGIHIDLGAYYLDSLRKKELKKKKKHKKKKDS